MASGVAPMREATPEPFWAPWVLAGQLTVSPEPRVQLAGAARVRYLVKLDVVPEPSERCTTAMASDGNLALGFSALISGASHLVIVPEKMPAMVAASSFRSFRPDTL